MHKQTLAVAALITALGIHPALGAENQKPTAAPSSESQSGGNPPGECEAVEKPGQQKMADGKVGATTGPDEKSAREINKEIVAGKVEKMDSSSPGGADAKSAKEINKEIVADTKTTETGEKVAATGPAKPVENWFGCPPKKDK